MSYQYLTYEERHTISTLRRTGSKLSHITQQFGPRVSTINRGVQIIWIFNEPDHNCHRDFFSRPTGRLGYINSLLLDWQCNETLGPWIVAGALT